MLPEGVDFFPDETPVVLIQLISNFLQVKEVRIEDLDPAVVLFPTKGDRFFCILETIPTL